MADMYGAVRSNWFKVHDAEAFKAWFTEKVKFGDSIEFWAEGVNDDEPGTVGFGGYEQYPSAWPNIPRNPDSDDDADWNDEQWDLEAFAAEVRKHLLPGEEFRVLAAGNEKLRYVQATHLIVTHEKVEFNDYYEGN